MIVHYLQDGGLELRDASEFKKFKVVLEGCAAKRPEIQGVRFVDDGNALVRIDAVPAYGWIDEAAGAIKAHAGRGG